MINIVITTTSELIDIAIKGARETSNEIIKLVDLEARPLVAGETEDDRRRKIAKLGLQLARTFEAIDEFVRSEVARMEAATQGHVQPATTNTNTDSDPNTN